MSGSESEIADEGRHRKAMVDLLLRPKTRCGICDFHAEDFRAFEYGDSVSAAYVVRNLRCVALIVHQEEVDVSDVRDDELFEAARKEMTGLLVASIADLGHGKLALEPPPNPVVNTLWFPPALLHSLEAIGLMTLEFLRAFLDDGDCGGHDGLANFS